MTDRNDPRHWLEAAEMAAVARDSLPQHEIGQREAWSEVERQCKENAEFIQAGGTIE